MGQLKPSYLVSQVALVVSDLDRIMEQYCRTLGWGPWNVYEYRDPWLKDLKAYGEPAEFTWLGAEARVGENWIELLQPLIGESPLADWHDVHGDGVHHVGYEVATMSEAEALYDAFVAEGASELISGWSGGLYFYYMDTSPVITEVWVGSAANLDPARVYPSHRVDG